MPFQSEKQRRFLHANHPEIAKRWEKEYATGGISNHFRKKFFTGALADTQGPAGGQAMSPGTSTTGGSRHVGGGGNGGTGGNGPKPHSGPTFAEIEAQKRAALEKKNLAAWEHSQTLKKTKTDRAKKTKYLKGLLKNDPLYETYVDKGLLDWENIKGYESDPRLKTDESLKAKQKNWWGYTKPWLGGGENLYISNLEEFGQEPKGPLHATRSGRWNETIAEKNKRIAETIGHEARHQLLGADNPAMFGDPYSGKVNEALYPQGFVDDETFNLPGKGTHELINTMGDFQAYNNPEIYDDIYGTIHGDMPRHLSSPVADQLYDASTQFTKDTKARHEGQKYENIDPVLVEGLKKEYPDVDVEKELRDMGAKEVISELSDVYEPRDYTGRAVKGNESTARLSKTQTKDLKPSKMYSTSDMKVAYEKAQNMNANQFKSWAKKEGLSGEYVDKLSSALDHNETSAGKIDMIGKEATKMLDLPGLGDDKQELKNAAGTLMGMVESSANKYDWNEKSDVKLSLANDFYKDKEKYKNLGINKVTDLDEFIDVVYTSVTKSQGIAEGGVARKNYFHGGILDINESEEIISDDGNDIELTDYNAAFDDPNDLSTGVKTLFQAKDGGTPQLAKKSKDGKRPGYGGPHDSYDAGQSYSGSQNTGGSTNRERGIQQAYSQPAYSPTGDASVAEQIAAADRLRIQQRKDIIEKGPGSDWEKYSDYTAKEASMLGGYTDDKRGQLYSTRTRIELEEAQKIQREKLNKWGLGQLGKLGVMLVGMLAMGIPLGDAVRYLPKTISLSKKDLGTLIKVSLPVGKAKKEHLKALDEYKTALLGKVDILNPNEMKSGIGTNISNITNEINDLTKTPDEDHTGGDGGIELPPQLGGPSTEEMATEYGMSDLDRIRAGQAKYAAYIDKIEREKLAREENPIVGTTEMDIIALRNSGGLANLFRVKNQ